jgi:lipopolysaccharide transport system permease protein
MNTRRPSTRYQRRGDDAPVLRLDSRPEPLGAWLASLWGYRQVLVALARQDFRSRYKRASLGILWSIAVPLVQSAVMIFIFSRVGNFGSGATFSYAGFVFAGMVPWIFLSISVVSSTTAIVDATALTEHVFFPRVLLPLVAPAANLISLAVSIVILVIALPIVGQPLEPHLLLILPATVLLVAFTAALGAALGGLYVYFRDVKFMVQAAILVWLYVTPIVYPPGALGPAARWLDFNPLTGIVGLFQRAAVDAPVPSMRAFAVSLGTTIALAILAIAGHRRHDRLFVDQL